MFDVRWLGILGCLTVAILALIIMYRERRWAQRKYQQELKTIILQPDFIAALREQLEKDVQDHVKKALKPLNKEVQEVIADIKKQTETAISQGLQANAQALEQSAKDQSTALKAVIETDAQQLKAKLQALSSSADSLQAESDRVLQDYRSQVLDRVRKLVDEQATDLLAEYLQSSVEGLELGDQQEFIIARLEANKAQLLQELGRES